MVSGSFGQCTGGAAAREAKAYGKTKQVLRTCYTRTSYK